MTVGLWQYANKATKNNNHVKGEQKYSMEGIWKFCTLEDTVQSEILMITILYLSWKQRWIAITIAA